MSYQQWTRREWTMNALTIVLAGLLLAVVLSGCAGPSVENGYIRAGEKWGPATSVPQVYMTQNGDRVSHYAPYFHPDL
jgi:hypothetical protein